MIRLRAMGSRLGSLRKGGGGDQESGNCVKESIANVDELAVFAIDQS